MNVNLSQLLKPLANKVFARLYFAQTISLLGDALTWVGLALLAFELGGTDAATILATSLTLRVTAFVIFSPYAGVLADRIDRKKILYVTHLARMVIVGLLAFITEVWQIYVLVFLLNVFNGFFTPTYKAVIPQVIKNKDEYAQAISLSSGTYQLLGVLGPGIAGGLAAIIGIREIFFLDAITFITAAILIFTLPGKLIVSGPDDQLLKSDVWSDVKKGTRDLFKDKLIRFALIMEFVAAIAGAQILINTVGHIKGALQLGSIEYGWAMSAFGIGATIAAFSLGILSKKFKQTTFIITGAFLIAFSITPANYVGIFPLIGLWLLAGFGQSYVEIPPQTLIAERIPINQQGKVYGAHFAWSHLWWAIAYPIAGFLGTVYFNENFLLGGVLSLILIFIVYIIFGKKIFSGA
ncbi:MAG: MFS transporter [Ignavibacteria bacterium]|nr:MFS transporter [Ignavibacteria bacterium]